MKNHLFLLLLALTGLLFFSSCSLMDESYSPVFTISLHLFSTPEVEEAELAVRIPDYMGGKNEIIRKFAFLDSRFIEHAELIPPEKEGGKYGVKLFPSVHHQLEVRRLSWEFPGQSFAVIVDQFYVGKASFSSHIEDNGAIEVADLWTKNDAEQIIKHVEKNFEYYNP